MDYKKTFHMVYTYLYLAYSIFTHIYTTDIRT